MHPCSMRESVRQLRSRTLSVTWGGGGLNKEGRAGEVNRSEIREGGEEDEEERQ